MTPKIFVPSRNAIIEAAKEAGAGAWQMTARLKAVELQGKFLKMWTEKIELGLDDKIIERLQQSRRKPDESKPEVPELPPAAEAQLQ